MESGEELWERSLGPKPSRWLTELEGSAEFIVWGQEDGGVICVRTQTGETVWETSVADMYGDKIKRPPDCVRSKIYFFGRLVVFETSAHVTALSLDTGQRVWTRPKQAPILRGNAQVGNRLYVQRAGWIDPRTGEYHLGYLEDHDEDDEEERLSGDLLISTTHVFGTTRSGTLHAWRRDGKHVWSSKPEGAQGFVYLVPLSAAHGRLYYVDDSQRTYCYEEVNPSDPVRTAQGGRPPEPPRSPEGGAAVPSAQGARQVPGPRAPKTPPRLGAVARDGASRANPARKAAGRPVPGGTTSRKVGGR